MDRHTAHSCLIEEKSMNYWKLVKAIAGVAAFTMLVVGIASVIAQNPMYAVVAFVGMIAVAAVAFVYAILP